MAAEITVGSIGLVSLLALFQTCNVAYNVFIRSAKNLGRDAHFLGIQLDMEQQKLRIWGQYLGISRSQQCRLLRAELIERQQRVVKYLESMRDRHEEIDAILSKYGMKATEPEDEVDSISQPALQDLDITELRTSTRLEAAQIRRTKTEQSIRSRVILNDGCLENWSKNEHPCGLQAYQRGVSPEGPGKLISAPCSSRAVTYGTLPIAIAHTSGLDCRRDDPRKLGIIRACVT